ncbi:MAG TPA: CsgG/HfaB family protein [Leptospiraceae bacterium]|nr:CsgG/HfaB family protein [Leptospiraceae bacterium]
MGRKPIRIVDSLELREKRKMSLDRIPNPIESKKKDNSIASSYNSDGFRDYIKRGCCIEIVEDAKLKIRYSSNVKSDLLYAPTVFLWMFSLGLIPVFEKVDAEIKIEVLDSNENILREYYYNIEEHAYNSWLTIPVSLILISNDSFAHSFIHMFDYPQRFIANKFETDFQEDLAQGKISENINILNQSKDIQNKSRIAILPIRHQFSKDQMIANAIRDKVETILVNKNFIVVERVKLDEILKEVKLSQTGLTTSEQAQIGSMLNASNLIVGELLDIDRNDSTLEFSLRNVDMETGKILWKYEFSIDEKNSTQSLQEAMKSLDSKIKPMK